MFDAFYLERRTSPNQSGDGVSAGRSEILVHVERRGEAATCPAS